MALTTETTEVRGIEQDVVITAGTIVDGDAQVILVNGLTAFDVTQLTAIQDSIDGTAITTMVQALAEYTMPNGQTGDVYYSQMIFDLADANERFVPTYQSYAPEIKATLAAHEATLADHEARITALEP